MLSDSKVNKVKILWHFDNPTPRTHDGDVWKTTTAEEPPFLRQD